MKTIIKKILLFTGLAIAFNSAYAQVSVGVGIGISAPIAPPSIPVYVQPDCPVDGYIWTPGYWNYSPSYDDYYWVPGVWVSPPQVGFLWTPCYWGFAGGIYGFHAGYWGPHVGFYGGINYGFGYGGSGYYGGQWAGGHFRYNTAVTRVNTRIVHNTYVNNNFTRNTSRSSFNGPGGSSARPTSQDALAARDHHVQATRNQLANQKSASSNRAQRAGVNHGTPHIAAMNRVNGSRFNAQGHAASATHTTAIRATTTHNTTMTHNAVQHQTNAASRQTNHVANTPMRQQAQQQRMSSRPQMQQQARPQMRPTGGGGGGHSMGGGGGDHRR
jgi:hypothetical protein